MTTRFTKERLVIIVSLRRRPTDPAQSSVEASPSQVSHSEEREHARAWFVHAGLVHAGPDPQLDCAGLRQDRCGQEPSRQPDTRLGAAEFVKPGRADELESKHAYVCVSTACRSKKGILAPVLEVKHSSESSKPCIAPT